MQIYLNEKPITVSETSLYSLLKKEGIESKQGIALAVNDQVIPRTKWDSFQLQDQDAIVLITVTHGG